MLAQAVWNQKSKKKAHNRVITRMGDMLESGQFGELCNENDLNSMLELKPGSLQ